MYIFHKEDLAVISISVPTKVAWKVIKQSYTKYKEKYWNTLVIGGLTNKMDQKKVMI